MSFKKVIVLAPSSICFLKTINYIEVQMYLIGINGLKQPFPSQVPLMENARPSICLYIAKKIENNRICPALKETIYLRKQNRWPWLGL